MKKVVVGYIYDSSKNLDSEDKTFLKLSQEKNMQLILINISKGIDPEEIKTKLKGCHIVFNNSGEDFAIEIVKTIESMGKKVIDKSKSYYYIQDKWIFYLKCKKNNIPVPETILLSQNKNILRTELKKFNHWPIVLKRIEGTCGEYVDKADNIGQSVKIIEKFWRKGSQKLPVIAQEFIKSDSYRLTIIDKKIVQTALKHNDSWKCTGVYSNIIQRFRIDRELKKIIKRLMKITDIEICGVDLIKKEGKWLVLEVNSEPAFDFFEQEEEKIISLVLDLLKKEAIRT